MRLNNTILIIIGVLLIFGINSCTQENKTKSDAFSDINEKFENTKTLAKHRTDELFSVFDQNISQEESDALKYLYAYMPLSDLADYNGDFFLNHVKTTFLSRNEIAWGKNIPDSIFKHFVLPHRVNNENLDTARIVFFNELKERVKGLSMYDAALEVNHWCHEKVEYRSADIRTSSPLATMKTAFGRCGEESTFTVAAMRSVCIPARQVYTPRWAHSDDNHAWVEVWTDGEWHFLGACEPLATLDLGWFSSPATRAMLIHARVFGDYIGNEEINISTSQYDDINVITRYAKTFKQHIKIVDKEGNPVPDAKVEYQLYNYAEFYPIATKSTDKNGHSFLTTGFGELLVWARNENDFGFEKVKIGEKDTVIITLSNPKFENVHWELLPPDASDFLDVVLSEEQINKNKIRLQYEDSVRNNYVSSFISKEEFLKIKNDENLWKFVKASRGNYQEIIDVIVNSCDEEKEWLEPLFSVIAAKDLRDTKAHILNDHLQNSLKYKNDFSKEMFTKYILNPRVANEILLNYRAFLNNNLGNIFASETEKEAEKIINWINDSLIIDNEKQAYNLPISPKGVYNLRVSDSKSRDIFFVAVCRSLGIPARLAAGSNTPQYFSDNQWIDVFFDGKPAKTTKFDVSFKVNSQSLKFTPQYYHHFSLAFFENNRFNTLELGEYTDIDKLEDFQLREGTYQLITSNRLSTGRILVDIQFLEIKEETVIGLDFPKKSLDLRILGDLNRLKLTSLIKSKNCTAKASQENSNIVVAIIEPDKEPSKHILNDIQKVKNDLDKLNSTYIFIIQKKNLSATFKAEDYNLPYNSEFIVVEENPELLLNIDIEKKRKTEFPMVLIVNKKGEIIYHSEGYKIGIGNDILKLL